MAESLERFAALVGDPAPLVYAALFARHPETEALFVMDRGGHVRGQMLAMAFEALLDPGRGGRLAGMVAVERMNHVNIGVDGAVFDAFLRLVRDVVREGLGVAWDAAAEAAWARRLQALA